MSLTPEQITQARSSVGIPAQGYGPPQTDQNAQSRLSALDAAWGAPKTAPTYGQRLASDVNAAGSQIHDQITGQGASAGENPVVRGVEAAGTAAGAIPTVAADLLPGAAGTAAKAVINAPGELANWLGEKIGNTKVAQDFVQAHPDAAQSLMEAAKVGSGLGSVAGTILGAEGVAKGGQAVVEKAPQAAQAVKESMTTPPGQAEATQAADNAAKLKSIASEWTKPANENSSSFNKARAVLSKDPGIPQTLAQLKINPFAHVENGKYNTADTAEALRETAGKMSNDVLRPSLEAADATTPKTPIADIVKSAMDNISKDKGLTATDRRAVASNITKEGQALAEDHPDGVGLSQAHDSKITYAQNGGYKPTSIADNNKAIANRAIASALQKTVENKAPAGLPVKEFNAELSKYYRAADYLDTLNTKKAPVSLAQNIAHRGAEVMGAVVGHGIGGGILGGVGGYMIGGALEHALENLSAKSKGQFLTNLKTTNPEAFTKVESYLNSTKQ